MSEDARWNLGSCVARLRAFTKAREWDRFHRPKELAAALSIEASELQETMLWKSDGEVEELGATEAVAEEVADVAIFLLMLADRLELDLPAAVHAKIDANERRYPATEHRGRAVKAPPES